ncbi:hypothetical protein [Kitasatospora sp. NPDC097643]|uniref:alpha/beta hydrolase n=1 Tax=Kitasatospora sp. NPDC097643 TaxID=3157230 RepID=UPI00331CFD66
MAQKPRIDVSLSLKESQATGAELAELAESIAPGVWFNTPLGDPEGPGRKPDVTWDLSGSRAKGQAGVYYANPDKRLRRPFIFADGFSYGPSKIAPLFEYFNTPYEEGKPGFFDQLLARGIDVIVLGFRERHTRIQDNAEVAIQAITQAIAERVTDERLIVGGVSMGGIVTRYALAKMETQRMDHQTKTYISYDSPHNGAWIPLILQQLAYFFDALATEKPSQADLIKSPAAQQLLWAWVPDSKYSGEVATSSPLRKEFLEDLERVGNFPRIPRLLGVSNGRGDGVGLPLTPGEVAFDWQAIVASATARIQPDKGDQQRVGGMHAVTLTGTEIRRSTTTEVPALDSVPGGTLDSFGRVADVLKAKILDDYRSGTFVPAVSAAALMFDPVAWNIDPTVDISTLSPEDFHLDAVEFDSANTEHSHVSGKLIDWIVEQIAY